MIEYASGNILEADVEALVNTVNCVGIMGRGIALQFKDSFPENFKAYKARVTGRSLQPGRMFVFETGYVTNPKYIINFPTKRHWRGKSRIEDIESGLEALVQEILKRRIGSIAIPPLGSGLGGLDWHQVRPQMRRPSEVLRMCASSCLNRTARLIDKKRAGEASAPKMTIGRAALVLLIRRYLAGLMDPFVTLLEVHKLLYFMQEAGQPLVCYTKAPYGPYAENLRHVLHAVEGYFVSGYADGGDAPNKQLELVPGAVADAEAFLKNDTIALGRFERVAGLVEGFETPFGLELLSSVHWIATREGAREADQAIASIYGWNDRKKRFSRRQIGLALDLLTSKGWLEA